MIGTLASKGQSGFGQDQDDLVIVPLRTVQRRMAGNSDVNSIMVSARDGVATEKVQADIERLMRAHNQGLPETKRILEVNPNHPVIASLRAAHESDDKSSNVADWIQLLYDQALIAEGSPLPDPAAFSRRLGLLMQSAKV